MFLLIVDIKEMIVTIHGWPESKGGEEDSETATFKNSGGHTCSANVRLPGAIQRDNEILARLFLSFEITLKVWLLSPMMHKGLVRNQIFNYALQYLFDIYSFMLLLTSSNRLKGAVGAKGLKLRNALESILKMRKKI